MVGIAAYNLEDLAVDIDWVVESHPFAGEVPDPDPFVVAVHAWVEVVDPWVGDPLMVGLFDKVVVVVPSVVDHEVVVA